ncbi:MAG: zinc-dependent metalloprotease [Acidobacteriota bacterium]
MNRKIVFQIALTFAIGLALGTGLVFANHPWICSGNQAYRWSSTTVRFSSPAREQGTVVRNAQNYVSAFNGSISVWNSTIINLTSGTQLRLFYGAYGNTGWLGLASISPSGCTITSAVSRINDTYMRNTSRYNQTAINHVACQEVGHTFGLGHNRSASNTCMNDTILTAGNAINQHDRDLLNAIY